MNIRKNFGEDEIVSITCSECHSPKLSLLQINLRFLIRCAECGFMSDLTEIIEGFKEMKEEGEKID